MILIDDRQIVQHPEIPHVIGVENSIVRLDGGDYCFVNSGNTLTGIEQSEIGNLVQKLRDGELESQLRKCQKVYASIILLVEGVGDSYGELLALYRKGANNKGYFRNYVYPRTTFEYLMKSLIRLSEMGIEIIPSPNFGCSIAIVRYIYEQRTKTEEEHTLFKRIRKISIPTKLTANPAVPKLMALVPRIPERTAIRLIHKFDSILGVLHAEDAELMGVEGVGRGLIANLRRSVGKP